MTHVSPPQTLAFTPAVKLNREVDRDLSVLLLSGIIAAPADKSVRQRDNVQSRIRIEVSYRTYRTPDSLYDRRLRVRLV